MANQNDEKKLENILQSEKVSIPSLSEMYQKKMTQNILSSANLPQKKQQGGVIFSYRYLLVAALLMLSIVVGSITLRQPIETQVIPSKIVSTPKMTNEEAVNVMIEKLNPDLIGVYASQLLKADSKLADQYHAELQVLSTLSNRIVTSFYDDLKPINHLENN